MDVYANYTIAAFVHRSGFLLTRKYDVSETTSLSNFRRREGERERERERGLPCRIS
jgi:hypothetical protein